MFKVRIKFSKEGELRFISHLDLIRTWGRLARRAELPLLLSKGFSPRPKMAFGPPLPLGYTSKAELIEIALVERMGLKEIYKRLAKQLPQGLRISKIEALTKETPALSTIKAVSYYVITRSNELEDEIQERVREFLLKKEAWIKRESPKGEKMINLRAGVFDLKFKKEGEEVRWEMLLSVGNQGTVRPEEVIEALGERGIELSLVDIQRQELYFKNCQK